MEKKLLFVAAICCVFILGSCKSKTSAYKNAYDQAQQDRDGYWDKEEEEDDYSEVRTTEEVSYEAVRERPKAPETLSRVSEKDEDDLSGVKRYGVVIGVFQNITNATSLKERMYAEGYRPVVAKNEKGMYRVIVSSFNSRTDANRARDDFKTKYKPNFKDAWVLERKY